MLEQVPVATRAARRGGRSGGRPGRRRSPSCRRARPPRRPTARSQKRRDQRRGVGGRRDQVEVAHGLAEAAGRAGDRDLHRRRVRPRPPPRPREAAAGPCRAARAAAPRALVACASAARIFSSDFAPRPSRSRSRCASAASRSSSTVVIPSSFQIRRAVFGPSPGRRMKEATSTGTSALRFVSAWISPSSTTSTIFSSIVFPIPWSSFARPVEREAARPSCRSRGSGRRHGGRRRSGTRRRPRAPSGRREARTGPRAPRCAEARRPGQRRAHLADHTHAPLRQTSRSTAMRATVCLPTYNELENLEPMVRALGEVLPRGRPRARDRRQLARRHRRAGRPAGRASCRTSTCCTGPGRRGSGPAYIAGFRRALADGAELVLEMDCDFSHDPAAVPSLIAAAEDGADLVLGSRYVPGGAIPQLGRAGAASSRAAGTSTRRSGSEAGCAT